MDINIRESRPQDLEVIVRFNSAMAIETEGKILEPETVTRGVKRALEDPERSRYFLAEVDGRVVGQIMFTLEWSDWRDAWFWWIQSVFVDPEYRGCGVFSRLYRFLYDLEEDPGETRNLAVEMPERLAALESLLDRWNEEYPFHEGDPVGMAEGEEERLRSLGYIE